MERFTKFVQDAANCEDPSAFIGKLREWLDSVRDEDFHSTVNYHKALGNEIRFTIYRLVSHLPLCTCGIAATLGIPESNVTHHVKVLEDTGLVYGKKEGRYTVYMPTGFALNQRGPADYVIERGGGKN
nr:metalloregulator ArsR/SmtB family transcription factor [Candidatus Sigynarchaeum springense]